MSASYVAESFADGRLRIADQADILFGAMWIVPGIALIAFFLYRAFRAKSVGPAVGALICCSLLLVGARVMKTSNLVLDKSNNTAQFHDSTFWGHDDFSLPLDSIDYAEVRSGNTSSRLMVVLKNGDGIQLGDTDQKIGKGRAAHAINAYIGRTK